MGPWELAFMTSATMTISGALAVINRIAQATSKNRLLPESAHGGSFEAADANPVGCAFCMSPPFAINSQKCFKQFTSMSNPKGVKGERVRNRASDILSIPESDS